ncbi:large-conductance mechanosensitive channel protein MscL [soil metagenome]
MRKIWSEYKDFINQGDVVTIAVGLVMALFFKDIIDAVVDGVLMPTVSLITGQATFGDIDFSLGDTPFEVGLVIRAAIIFLAVAFVLYLIVKGYNSYIAKPHQEIEASDTELSLLKEIRDELRAGSGASGFGGTPPPPPTV